MNVGIISMPLAKQELPQPVGFIEEYLPLQSPRTHNIGFHKHKITSLLTVHPRAEPYRIEHSNSQFSSARILFEPYIVEREHWDPDSVRLTLENSERGGDSARKCSVRYGTVRGCTVRIAQSAPTFSQTLTVHIGYSGFS